MDDAIARAEREAQDSERVAKYATENFRAWSEGERQVIDSLKRIGDVIKSDAFLEVSRKFVEQHKHVFEFTDENKLEYTALHEQYVELMEKTLVEMASDVDIDSLVGNLPEFMEGGASEQDPEQTGATIDFLLSLTDFPIFKSMMLAARDEATTGPAPALDTSALDSSAHVGVLTTLNLPTPMRAALAPLAKVNEADNWQRLAEKKGEYVMETTRVDKTKFSRMTMSQELPPPRFVECFVDFTDPGSAERHAYFTKVDVLKHEQNGKVTDILARMHLSLPGILKALKLGTDTWDVRMTMEADQPEPGCTACCMVSWDVEKDGPKDGRMAMSRLTIVRPSGDGTQCTMVESMPPLMPEWMFGVMMSNAMKTQFKTALATYKKQKGLA